MNKEFKDAMRVLIVTIIVVFILAWGLVNLSQAIRMTVAFFNDGVVHLPVTIVCATNMEQGFIVIENGGVFPLLFDQYDEFCTR